MCYKTDSAQTYLRELDDELPEVEITYCDGCGGGYEAGTLIYTRSLFTELFGNYCPDCIKWDQENC